MKRLTLYAFGLPEAPPSEGDRFATTGRSAMAVSEGLLKAAEEAARTSSICTTRGMDPEGALNMPNVMPVNRSSRAARSTNCPYVIARVPSRALYS